jgi:glycosyltransferase involved in cell wall biosynthesis
MNYPEYEGHYAPQSIDSEQYGFRWIDRDVPLIMHSPSHRGRKGTDRIFLPALEILRKKGYKFDFEMIENKRHDRCVAMKSQATIFLGQIGVGFYSNSALEAMQFGIPTVAWISEAAVQQSDGIVNFTNCPIINAKPDVQHCAQKLERLLSDREYRSRKARATKAWCDRVHSYSATAQRWQHLLEKVI